MKRERRHLAKLLGTHLRNKNSSQKNAHLPLYSAHQDFKMKIFQSGWIPQQHVPIMSMESPCQPHRVETPCLSLQCMHACIHSFPQYLLNAFYISGTDLGSAKRAVVGVGVGGAGRNQHKILALMQLSDGEDTETPPTHIPKNISSWINSLEQDYYKVFISRFIDQTFLPNSKSQYLD